MSAEKAWTTIEDLALYKDEGWNEPVFLKEGSLNYKNSNMEQLLGIMECKVDTLMKDAISLMERSENIYGPSSNTMHQLPPEPSHQDAFESLVMNSYLTKRKKFANLKNTCAS
ncbi:hypothetical protein Tco_0851399 [Tanacetum coccineum]